MQSWYCPADLSAAWQRREVATIGVHLDASQQQSAGTALSIVQQVIEGVQREFTQQPSLVTVETHSVQAENFRPIDYIAPGILALSVAQLGLFGATTLVEQRQQRLLRRLQATPVSRWMVLLSNIVVRLAIALVQTGILLGVALALFRIQVVGSWPAIIGIVVFGTLAFIALGFLLGALAPSAEALIAIVQMVNFPMMFLSGALFPLDFMPEILRPVAVVLPLTYLADILRQVMVDATPYATMLQGMGALLAFMVASAAALVAFLPLGVEFISWVQLLCGPALLPFDRLRANGKVRIPFMVEPFVQSAARSLGFKKPLSKHKSACRAGLR